MIIHKPDINAFNEFFTNGLTMLQNLDKIETKEGKYNANLFRTTLAESWMEAARQIKSPLVQLEMSDTNPLSL